ncbi:FAD dependent oxidoreductase [Aspergillus flavus]|uniref:FAD dependent oxidoreductase n=1 Tax=Aspergillus flavus (strain ATCC 200026 / FGSC A1120 / IAM 13836 / NRRL 3357 / JCM 12722 / SRRC 167) TaxID=332952 RepID=A0A7U2MPI4_ASPFN|nr:uncharacterized protein G4B84_001626 [Aspergillus flavus NRRL3357]QRD87519.1 FAD dependent oxidoreductase [Aspergillus flavus]KAF7627911.1 hypothetical protein AFLA_003279 [Aspergillus flavus NRRL3357]QMW26381.1 hypothetical protein G4B84_001626 [Aspergillus flavus NRRL3357]RAQ60905.1 hypothetical protein COH21_008099 [Aspergillus flavus]RAQ76691.1 hypothetical protein COH20_010816 [Aspergillus flavus]
MRIQLLLAYFSLSAPVLAADPGLPMDDPTISYWQLPPHPDVADRQSPRLPDEVDIVIIGAGITGTSIARWLLHDGSQDHPLRIAMIEARQSCSGGTGRNAGHIRPTSWDYAKDKAIMGAEEAAKIVRFKARHFTEYTKAVHEDLDVAAIDAAEVRAIDSIDAWFADEDFNSAVEALEILKREVPDIGKEWIAYSGKEAQEKTLIPDVVGIFAGTPKTGGAMWPYRFVTNMQAALLKKYPTFSIDTHTPALNITQSQGQGKANFEVETPRGTIRARHVVHAEGAWIPHLIPKLDGHLTQARWPMTAQSVGDKIPDAGHWPALFPNGSEAGGRGWGLWRDYYASMLQQPKTGLFIGGGGIAGQALYPEWDDASPVEPILQSYLGGFMTTFFGYENWGAERPASPPQKDIFPGRTKGVWTGIDSISFDEYPVVGPLPPSTTGRQARIGAGAEWICTGYSGDGMPSAWLSGKALSEMILQSEKTGRKYSTWPDWFPKAWVASEERLSKPVNSTSVSSKTKRSRFL